jgi:hypothetical protein
MNDNDTSDKNNKENTQHMHNAPTPSSFAQLTVSRKEKSNIRNISRRDGHDGTTNARAAFQSCDHHTGSATRAAVVTPPPSPSSRTQPCSLQVQSTDNINNSYSSMRQKIHKWKRQLQTQLQQENHLLQAIEQTTKGGVCAPPTSASAAARNHTKLVAVVAAGADVLYRELLQTALLPSTRNITSSSKNNQEKGCGFDHRPVCDWRTHIMESTRNASNGIGKMTLMNDSLLQIYRSSTVILEMVEQSLANRNDVLREACNEFVRSSLGSEAKMAMAFLPSLDPEQIVPVMANIIC